jgi:hypothetical protein
MLAADACCADGSWAWMRILEEINSQDILQ